MSYIAPTGTIDPTWLDASEYQSPRSNLTASWATSLSYVAPVGFTEYGAGYATLFKEQFAGAYGIGPGDVASTAYASFDGQYVNSQFICDASWDGASPYSAPILTASGVWANVTYVSPLGIEEEGSGEPLLIWQQFVDPEGITPHRVGDHYALYSWQYAYPLYLADASWVGKDAYTSSVTSQDAAWAIPQEDKLVSLVGWESSAVPSGTAVEIKLQIVGAFGFSYSKIGTAKATLGAVALKLHGFDSQVFSRPTVFNYNQYLRPSSFTLRDYMGAASLQGGQKTLSPRAWLSQAFSRPDLINTTANQYVSVRGMDVPKWQVSVPDVSPRFIYHQGVNQSRYGFPVVGFPPAPKGWLSSGFGYPVIDYKTKRVTFDGFESSEFSYPKLDFRNLFVDVPAIIRSSIFGDTALLNLNKFISAEGFLSEEFYGWQELRLLNRELFAYGRDSFSPGQHAVENDAQGIFAKGFDSLTLASTDTAIGYQYQVVVTRGLYDSRKYGRPTFTKTPSLNAKGLNSLAVGQPTIWPRVREVFGRGFNTQRFGDGDVWYQFRYVEAKSFTSSAVGRNARAEHEHRGIGTKQFGGAVTGRVSLSHKNKHVSVDSIFEVLPSNHIVGTHRDIKPFGFVATQFGKRIIPEILDVYMHGFTGVYGWPTVHNSIQDVFLKGFTATDQPADQWGRTRIQNNNQHVSMVFDVTSDLNPPQWPTWTLIENVNRSARATGFIDGRTGRHQISNNARLVRAKSVSSDTVPAWRVAGMVDFKIRSIRPDSQEAPYISGWGVVHNAAFVIGPEAFQSSSFGRLTQLEKNRRYFKFIGWDSAYVPGYHMISYAVRELTFQSRYGIHPPIIRLPEVGLYSRYVDPIGYDNLKTGLPALHIHWRIARPRWAHVPLFGMAEVQNNNPEVKRVSIGLHDEYGSHSIEHMLRCLEPEWEEKGTVQKPDIAFRDRTVAVRWFSSLGIGDKINVANAVKSLPYTTQEIVLSKYKADTFGFDKLLDEGHGIKVPERQVGTPQIKNKIVYVSGISSASEIGRARVIGSSIRVPGYQEAFIFGEPTIGNKGLIEVDARGIGPTLKLGMPRLSPHTIWAAKAPSQAVLNHGLKSFYPIDRPPGSVQDKLGRARVASPFDAPITPKGVAHSNKFGSQRLSLRDRIIFVGGFGRKKIGLPDIPIFLRELEQFDSVDSLSVGRAKISRPALPFLLSVKPSGMQSNVFGRCEAQLFHREVSARGFVSSRLGSSRGGTRYMPQSLSVNFPDWPEAVGFDAAIYGEPWVSFKIREVRAAGWDSFLMEYDYQNFEARMVISRHPEETIQSYKVDISGFGECLIGSPDLRNAAHFIKPDGNSEQYRKGAF